MTSLYMTAPAAAPLPRLDAILDGMLARAPRIPEVLRAFVLAAFLLLPVAAILHADETRPGWLPEAMVLPEDMEVITERTIGSTLRMFSFSTEEDTAELLADWEEELSLSGYSIVENEDNIINEIIEFSGPGINNAKVVIAPINEDGRAIVELDASLQ